MFEATQGFVFYRKYGKMVRTAVLGLLTQLMIERGSECYVKGKDGYPRGDRKYCSL